MPPATQTHRTPLRRVSRSSLSALARSSTASHPTPLSFLEPVLSDLADEADALHHNLGQLNALHAALDTFNESFASYLYALRMNAFCVEWQQAPAEESFARATEAAAATAALLAQPPTPRAPTPTATSSTSQAAPGDTTYATTQGSPTISVSELKSGIPKAATKAKAKPKPKLNAAEKRKRDAEMEKIIQVMPIEYRGNDPDLRRAIEAVVTRLMDAPSGLKVLELVKPPDLPQARVNKCLIALVNKKIVKKTSQNGVTVYSYIGTGVA